MMANKQIDAIMFIDLVRCTVLMGIDKKNT